MTAESTIVELRRRAGMNIYAVVYRKGRRGRTIRLPDGAIVETATPWQRCEAPAQPELCLGLAPGGELATPIHTQLGLVNDYLPLEGVFFLPSGEVAAVYGAEAVTIS